MGPALKLKELNNLIKLTGKAFIRPLRHGTLLVENTKDCIGLFIGCLIDYDFRLHSVGKSALNALKLN
jgi:hypothetical protein